MTIMTEKFVRVIHLSSTFFTLRVDSCVERGLSHTTLSQLLKAISRNLTVLMPTFWFSENIQEVSVNGNDNNCSSI